MFGSGSKTRFRDILDGSSNTIAFWEITGGEDYSFYWIDNGAFPTLWGWGDTPATTNFNQLGTYHTGGAQVLMGDGSCRFISENIDAAWGGGLPAGILHNLTAMADGNVLGEF